MTTRYVYLAGPIGGCTQAEANDWREMVADALPPEIVGISPLRCEPLVGERYGLHYADPMFGTARAISSKNLMDVRQCDVTLAFLPRWATERAPSYGTVIEMAWAHALGKPVILVTDDEHVREHAVVNACAGWVLPTLREATDLLVGLFGGYVGGKNV